MKYQESYKYLLVWITLMTEKGSTFGKNWLHRLVIAINAMEGHDYSSYLLLHFLLLPSLEYIVIMPFDDDQGERQK